MTEKEKMDFDKNYFERYYRNYLKQNPLYKLKTYLNFLLKYTKRGSLLDIGCSCGLFVELSSEHFDCFGMDVDFEVVSEAAKRVPHSSLVCGALPNIPFKCLDIITLLDVIEHVQDLRSSLEALKGSLRPGGIALVVVPVYDGPLGWLVKKLDADPTHIHKRSRAFWLDLAEKYFELVEWRGIFRMLFFGKFYLNLTTLLLRQISPAIIIVLRNRKESQL